MVWLIAIAVPMFGHFVIRWTVLHLRKKHKIYRDFKNLNSTEDYGGKDDYNRSTGLLGFFESYAYFFSIVFGFEQFIGWWLVVKAAGRWSPGGPPPEVDPIEPTDSDPIKKEKKRRGGAALNIFLIGNLLNIFFGVGGGLIIKHSDFFCQMAMIKFLSDIYHLMAVKISWDLVALICTIPTAFLAFKSRFIENFEIQCLDLLKKKDRDYKRDIRVDQRILARLMFGVNESLEWLQTFDSESELRKKLEYDRSDATRGLFWFILFLIFTVISLFSR